MALYGLVAWPPGALSAWLRQEQRRLGLAAYGPPHLNVRTPFEWNASEADLCAVTGGLLQDLKPFEVQVKGWRFFPNTTFLEMQLSTGLADAHARMLSLTGRAAQNGEDYIPHLTLALGVLPWAEPDIRRAASALAPPVTGWTVNELALTLDARGDLREVARFRLGQTRPSTSPWR